MTEDEARRVARIFATADGGYINADGALTPGCTNCSYALVEEAERDFPAFPWRQWMDEFWKRP